MAQQRCTEIDMDGMQCNFLADAIKKKNPITPVEYEAIQHTHTHTHSYSRVNKKRKQQEHLLFIFIGISLIKKKKSGNFAEI